MRRRMAGSKLVKSLQVEIVDFSGGYDSADHIGRELPYPFHGNL